MGTTQVDRDVPCSWSGQTGTAANISPSTHAKKGPQVLSHLAPITFGSTFESQTCVKWSWRTTLLWVPPCLTQIDEAWTCHKTTISSSSHWALMWYEEAAPRKWTRSYNREIVPFMMGLSQISHFRKVGPQCAGKLWICGFGKRKGILIIVVRFLYWRLLFHIKIKSLMSVSLSMNVSQGQCRATKHEHGEEGEQKSYLESYAWCPEITK